MREQRAETGNRRMEGLYRSKTGGIFLTSPSIFFCRPLTHTD